MLAAWWVTISGKILCRYLSNFLGKKSTDKDDENDFTDWRNVLLTDKNDVTEQDQECQVGKL